MKDDTSVFSQIVTLAPAAYFSQKLSTALQRENARKDSVLYNLELDGRPKLSCVTVVELNIEHFPFNQEQREEEVQDQAF
jgi:hypothetical protein